MDTFSHALWGYGLFGFRQHPRLALFFGAMPDLFSFGLLLLINLFNGSYEPGPPKLETIPAWVSINYSITHSFVICLPIIGLMALYRRDIAFAMLAWPFHILLDIPTHSQAFFPTPMLWPVSDFTVNGIPWSNPWIWFPNVAGIVVLLLYRHRHVFRRRKQQQKY